MSKVLEIRKAVQAALKNVHSRVWYERAPDGAQFPYITYLLSTAIDAGTLERYLLDVNGWDAPSDGSTAALETLMEAVDRALQKRVVCTDDVSFVIYRDRRLSVEDTDPRIRRRMYVYELRAFQRRSEYHG